MDSTTLCCLAQQDSNGGAASHGASVDVKDSEASQQDAAYIVRFQPMFAAGQALKVQYVLCVCRVRRR